MSATAKSRTGVYHTWPEQFLLRLTREQKQRLETTARRLGKKMNDFVRDCVTKALDDLDAQHEQKKERRREEQREAFVPRNANPPRGLNLRPRAPVASPPEPIDPPAPSTTVIVQQAAPGSSIDHLAAYVLGAKNTIDRQERERQVQKIIEGGAATQEDAERVAKALDDKIAAAQPTTKTPTTPTGFSRWLTGG